MKTLLNNVSDFYDAVQLDLHKPRASAIRRSERQPGLIGLIVAWGERTRFRGQLATMARDTPELIDDIGLTMAEVNAEIAKPFWRR